MAKREARQKKKQAKKADPEQSDESEVDSSSTGTDTDEEVFEKQKEEVDPSGRSEIAGPER